MAVRNVEAELAKLTPLRDVPSAEALPALGKALGDRINVVVAKAAKIAAERQMRDLIPDLLRALDRLFEKPAERDPQCWGKNALAQALVDLEHREACAVSSRNPAHPDGASSGAGRKIRRPRCAESASWR